MMAVIRTSLPIIDNLWAFIISCCTLWLEKSWKKYLNIDTANTTNEKPIKILDSILSFDFIFNNKLSKPIDAKTHIENCDNINIIDGTLNLLK